LIAAKRSGVQPRERVAECLRELADAIDALPKTTDSAWSHFSVDGLDAIADTVEDAISGEAVWAAVMASPWGVLARAFKRSRPKESFFETFWRGTRPRFTVGNLREWLGDSCGAREALALYRACKDGDEQRCLRILRALDAAERANTKTASSPP
jgi:hypothetical protein